MNGAETMAWSRYQQVARGYLGNAPPRRIVLQTHINTVDDRTFPTVHAATLGSL